MIFFPSKIYLFKLHLCPLNLEDRVFKNIHDVFCGAVEVVSELFLADHSIRNGGGLVFRALLQPSQKLLIFFLSLESVENIGLLAQKTIDWGITVGIALSVTHEVKRIILMIINIIFKKRQIVETQH